MPLLDHFHPPLRDRRHWEAFHGRWAAAMSDALNRDLPQSYFAEFQVHVGSRVEVDVGAFDDQTASHSADGGGTAVLSPKTWAPVKPALILETEFPDIVEVQVFSNDAGPVLVGAVELVSPGNKDREPVRRAFAAKCASYLQQGVGLVIVDVVTSRSGNLHQQVVQLVATGATGGDRNDDLYAVAYHPVREPQRARIDVWPYELTVGEALPTVPLWLDKGYCVPLDLDAAYDEACRAGRLT